MFYTTHMTPELRRYTSARRQRPNNLHNIRMHTPLVDRIERYRTQTDFDFSWSQFRIPKASGGFRTITAPSEQLKAVQGMIVDLLREDYRILETDWSFAYVKRRCTTNANERHVANNSRYFLKIDIQDFFDSITLPLIQQTIDSIYPTCTFPAIERRRLAEIINQFCLFEGRTPQGGVSSPFLSNWVITPFIYNIRQKINQMARDTTLNQIPKQRYVITIYADDITISARDQFNWHQIQDAIQEVFGDAFRLKREKTKYTRNSGRNHMLGKVLNKDHQITCGYKKVRNWKQILLQLCNEVNGSVPRRNEHDRRVILGQLNWDFNTQREYLEHLISKYERKFTSGRSILAYLKGAA